MITLVAVHLPLLFGLGSWLPIVLVVLLALIAVLAWWPSKVFRFLLWLFVRSFYRLDVIGQENIPERGPALLVCNHVSYIDWVLLGMAQRRFIRFVIFAGWTHKLFIRHVLRWGRVIPIDASSGPKAILKSLRTAGEALKENDLVCIFAEGRFTRTGFLLPFHRGLEQIVKNQTAPIIPVFLDELWGSIFSFYGDRTLWKWPRMVPYPVTVAFGKPMPSASTAAEVRMAVQKLAADCAMARSQRCRPVHREFVRTAARRPLRPCIIDASRGAAQPQVFRYSQMLAEAWQVSRQLRKRLGKLPDDSSEFSLIGIWLLPGRDATAAHLAAAFCHQPVVPLDPLATPEVLQAIFQQCNFKLILTTADTLSRWPLPPGAIEFIDLELLRKKSPSFWRSLSRCCAILLPGIVMERWILRLSRHSLDDVAAMVFTRGSTGRPKGVALSHRNIVAAVNSISKSYELTPQDRLLGVLPLAGCTGYIFTLWTPLSSGMSVVITAGNLVSDSDPKLQTEQLGTLCRTFRCTILPLSPELLNRCFEDCLPDDFRTLRAMVTCGAKLEPTKSDEFLKRFGIRPLEAYDSTELTSLAATNVPDKTLENFTQVGNKPGTVGQPLPGLACRIVHPQTQQLLPPGEIGLVQWCGANITRNYLHSSETIPAEIQDGWLTTDDQGHLDEDGFITLV